MIGEAFNAGETIQILMERYQVSAGTIVEHLTRYVSAGNKLRNGEDLQSLTSATEEQKQAAFTAFDELGPNLLKPIFDKLDGAMNYDELRILRILYLAAQQ